MPIYDVIVVGLGAVGSAALHYAARAGASVLGIDRFTPPHARGSSHGETRITRAAIGEGIEYAPLAIRSNALWRELEAVTGRTLFVQCGCLSIPNRHGTMSVHGVPAFLENIRAAAARHGIATEALDEQQLRRRYPQFAVRPGSHGVLDKWGGYLFPEECIRSHLEQAETFAAAIRTGETVVEVASDAGGLRVVSAGDGRSETHRAGKVLIATGAWLPRMVGAVQRRLTVTRQVLFWFEVARNAKRFDPAACPVFIWDVGEPDGPASHVYGFPLYAGEERGLKITHEETGRVADPDEDQQPATAEETAHMQSTYVAPYFPDLGPRCLDARTCFYTRQDNARFIIDWHPDKPNVAFASACSGHGFKHSAAVGEGLAEMLLGQSLRTGHAMSAAAALAPFSLPAQEPL